MISPEGFRELRKSVPLSRKACAEYLGCSVSTVRSWDRGLNRVPWSAVRLLRLLRLGDLGALESSWDGWSLRGDRLVSPEGHSFAVSDLAWWSLTCRQAEGFRKAFDNWWSLSEVFRALARPISQAPGVAGVPPADDALEPARLPVTGCRGVDVAGSDALPAEPALLLGDAAHAPRDGARSAPRGAGLVSKSTSVQREAESQQECGLQRVDVEPEWGHNGATIEGGHHARHPETQPAIAARPVRGSGGDRRSVGDQPQRLFGAGNAQLDAVPAPQPCAACGGGFNNRHANASADRSEDAAGRGTQRALPVRERFEVQALPREGLTAWAAGGGGRA
ncbi:MAG TPA: VC1465 family Xer recombination activation factor [Acidobacteriaceae bacterium]|nr:VC1465 family Xer recombination activation factor [Acidobacteriaceae bacterium]